MCRQTAALAGAQSALPSGGQVAISGRVVEVEQGASVRAKSRQGLYQPAMKRRLAEVVRQKQALNARLSEAGGGPAVHPNPAQAYRRRVAELESLLEDPDLRDETIVSDPVDDREDRGAAA
ncbi:hypothetical protein [Bosea sp. (in: a-proteobacteria)]|uniref:hypothetical protein n=1 Tax=Bosea sp. (in: a-proteobacteria) TaxID=1871050 RepID=UPI002625BAEF|nr:hypothetical protein [Bosea sp. (in: a-proteobacteria)]MCO5090581.1 hypothetical protein [Bosea sp. (in: a-proteobacteria)]